MKKTILVFNCLMLAAGGVQASELEKLIPAKQGVQLQEIIIPVQESPEGYQNQEQGIPIDLLPEFVILEKIVPELDPRSLLNWAKSSKKYAKLFENELNKRKDIIKILKDFSVKSLEDIIKSPGELENLPSHKEILKKYQLAPEQLKCLVEFSLSLKSRQSSPRLIEPNGPGRRCRCSFMCFMNIMVPLVRCVGVLGAIAAPMTLWLILANLDD